MVGALGAKPVGQREVPIEVADVEIGRDGGQLMNDHLGLRLSHHRGHLVGDERVGHDGLGSKRANLILLGSGARHPDHLVTGLDEARDQLLSQGAGRAGDEHFHLGSFSRQCHHLGRSGSSRCDDTQSNGIVLARAHGELEEPGAEEEPLERDEIAV